MPSPLDTAGAPLTLETDALEGLIRGPVPRALVERIPTEGARLQVGGRVPSLSRMVEMTDAELSLLAKRFGVDPERVAMTEQAIERATSRLLTADAPDRGLMEQVMRSAESAVRVELQNAAKRLVRDYTQERLGVEAPTMMRWVSVVDEARCQSCEDRHGDVKSMAQWEDDGEPGSGNLRCNGRCRCQLYPQEVFE